MTPSPRLDIAIRSRCGQSPSGSLARPLHRLPQPRLPRLGATRPEILDMLAVAVEMGGGPSAIYGAQALACYDEMAAGQG